MPKELQKGIDAFQQGEIEDSIEIFVQILKKDPNCAPAFLWLGHCSMVAGDFVHAIHHFEKVLELGNPELKEEAKKQIKILRFSKWMQRLVYKPLLLTLLVGILLVYLLGYLFSYFGKTGMGTSMHQIAVFVLLPGFFFWAFFIISFFGVHAYFNESPQKKYLLAGFFLCLVLWVPVNLYKHVGIGIWSFSLFLNLFLPALFLSVLFYFWGRKALSKKNFFSELEESN